MLILNEHHLRRILTRYLEHYNTARPHRSMGQLSPSQAETGPRVLLAVVEVHRLRQPTSRSRRTRLSQREAGRQTCSPSSRTVR
ncbi:integrase core domain-containing protein [Nonomuraea angiospora]|uniref:integrase core domain-containing protein n=1 Tax=Nonomuraea angiospora TaxID=46172 RepID=UPI0034185BA0